MAVMVAEPDVPTEAPTSVALVAAGGSTSQTSPLMKATARATSSSVSRVLPQHLDQGLLEGLLRNLAKKAVQIKVLQGQLPVTTAELVTVDPLIKRGRCVFIAVTPRI